MMIWANLAGWIPIATPIVACPGCVSIGGPVPRVRMVIVNPRVNIAIPLRANVKSVPAGPRRATRTAVRPHCAVTQRVQNHFVVT